MRLKLKMKMVIVTIIDSDDNGLLKPINGYKVFIKNPINIRKNTLIPTVYNKICP
jgi:hypothetical protein